VRLGFVLGFLIGGAIATLLGKSQEVEAPGLEGGSAPRSNPIKQHVDEARDAAKEAQLEKEAEMLRLYDEMVHRKGPPADA
jgi:hypothetical protein